MLVRWIDDLEALRESFKDRTSAPLVTSISGVPQRVGSAYTWVMSTLHDLEAIVARFSPEELAELEKFVRQTRLEKTGGGGQSALDLPPLDLGRSRESLGSRDEWYDEMLEGRV